MRLVRTSFLSEHDMRHRQPHSARIAQQNARSRGTDEEKRSPKRATRVTAKSREVDGDEACLIPFAARNTGNEEGWAPVKHHCSCRVTHPVKIFRCPQIPCAPKEKNMFDPICSWSTYTDLTLKPASQQVFFFTWMIRLLGKHCQLRRLLVVVVVVCGGVCVCVCKGMECVQGCECLCVCLCLLNMNKNLTRSTFTTNEHASHASVCVRLCMSDCVCAKCV